VLPQAGIETTEFVSYSMSLHWLLVKDATSASTSF
jgi:hypothetical protein